MHKENRQDDAHNINDIANYHEKPRGLEKREGEVIRLRGYVRWCIIPWNLVEFQIHKRQRDGAPIRSRATKVAAKIKRPADVLRECISFERRERKCKVLP